MILIFLKRRLWLTQNHLYSTLVIAMMLPLVLYFTVIVLMKPGLRPILHQSVSIGEWLYPSLLIIIGMIAIIPYIYRDLFDLRVHKKFIIPVTLSPINKQKIIFYILCTAVIESILYIIISMAVLSVGTGIMFKWYEYLVILGYASIFTFLIGNLLVSLALLTEHVTVFLMSVIIVILFLLLGGNILFSSSFLPGYMTEIISFFPNNMILDGLRIAVFSDIIKWSTIIVPTVIIVVWTIVNGEIFKRKLKQ